MTQDLFVTGPRGANDLAGVFECEEGVPYFYLYRTDAPDGSKVIGAIPVFLNMEHVSQDDVSIRWSHSGDIVGLFLLGELVAAFEVSSGEKFGGTDLEGKANPLPDRIAAEFSTRDRLH